MPRRGKKDSPAMNALYIVRSDLRITEPFGLPIGSTQAAIDSGIAAARTAGYTVSVTGNVITLDIAAYLADYFNGDVYLHAGNLLKDLGSELILVNNGPNAANGAVFIRAKLVSLVNGQSTEGAIGGAPFYVTTYESYGPGGFPNGSGNPGNTSDVFVNLVSHI